MGNSESVVDEDTLKRALHRWWVVHKLLWWLFIGIVRICNGGLGDGRFVRRSLAIMKRRSECPVCVLVRSAFGGFHVVIVVMKCFDAGQICLRCGDGVDAACGGGLGWI
ncbi:Hypothetical predicted protein [Olea europaea subsp. europaea]|uniref:Transmembrane protein n=1 Tax=Olea europaea subsp. europaea TaxID=158383 RepID=A0A8S0QCF6_OLEEU|nr:Hypothetical predicted protein [Olea europaea subsp. europaea]